MGFSTKSAGGKVNHGKDVVHVLMETLVDPVLPWGSSVNKRPSEAAQESVAKQMHAVVLLYNYYHRKQNLELEFLNFTSFCELAVSLKRTLLPFMKSMELSDGDDHLSLTEKAIKDACDISMALDASRDVPITEEFPLSKVAVLLVDSKYENCFLHFGGITEGVWSLIEKEISDPNKRKPKAQLNGPFDLVHHALGAVKDAKGFGIPDLVVLGSRVTYSLSAEKSAAYFYIIECNQTFTENESIPIKVLLEKLEGPIAKKDLESWTTTSVVEHYHMLPYVDAISCWLSGNLLPMLSGGNGQSWLVPVSPVPKYNGNGSNCADNNISSEENQKKRKCSSGSIEKDRTFTQEFDKICDTLYSAKEDANGTPIESLVKYSVKHENKASFSSNSRGSSQETVKDDNVIVDLNNKTGFMDPDGDNASAVGYLNGCSPRTVKDDNVIMKFRSRSNVVESAKNEALSQKKATVKTVLEKFNKKSKISDSDPDGMQRLNAHDFTTHEKPNAYSDTYGPEDDVNLKAKMGDSLRSKSTLCRYERVPENNGDVNSSCNQNGIAVTECQLVPFGANIKYSSEMQNVTASDDLQNALALLYRKRQELGSQIVGMEDMLALCEDNIERIRDVGDAGLARKCTESILSGDYLLLLKNEAQTQDKAPDHGQNIADSQASEKQTRSHDIYLPGNSSYQDLEYACLMNNWRLPRYSIEPSYGKFEANVVVEGKDLKLSSKGGLKANPSDARESAAAQMILKIKSSF